MPKTRLITITKRVTEKQYLQLEEAASNSVDSTIEEWFCATIDELVSANVSEDSWSETDQSNPDARSRFYAHALNRKEE